jgi:hypothetical protein
MTFAELTRAMYARGYTMADAAVDRMKALLEDETGIWPDPDETPPAWVLVACGFSPRMLNTLPALTGGLFAPSRRARQRCTFSLFSFVVSAILSAERRSDGRET